MIRLDPIARVHRTARGVAFNRFATQLACIGASRTGSSFLNTATRAHASVIPCVVIVTTTRIRLDPSGNRLVGCASDNSTQPAALERLSLHRLHSLPAATKKKVHP